MGTRDVDHKREAGPGSSAGSVSFARIELPSIGRSASRSAPGNR